MPMRESTRSILFLAVMALVVSNGLTAISLGLKQRVDDNREMLRVRSLLEAMAAPGSEGETDEQLLQRFRQTVIELDGEPRVYIYREDGRDLAYGFEVNGRGLWDRIKGFLVVEPDKLTVRGLRFYEQNETPGLGGEIGTAEFQRRFVGKKLRDGQGLLRIVKAGSVAELDATEVNGITGATLTCDAVNKLMADSITRFLEYAEQMQ